MPGNEVDQKPIVINKTTPRLFRGVLEMVPDIAEAFFSAFVGSSVADILKKAIEIGSRPILEAQIQEDAEKKFRAKISIEETKVSIDLKNPQKTADYLTKEVKQVAEDAVQLNDQKLMKEVMDFYHSSTEHLLLFGPNGSQDKKIFATIWSQLGVVRLKVMWADAQREARQTKEVEKSTRAVKEFDTLKKQERLLQLAVFILLVLYVGVIAIIIYRSQYLTSISLIPVLGIPVAIVLWSALGSLANLLYKYYK